MTRKPTSLPKLFEPGAYIDTSAPGFSARVVRATHWPTGQDVALKVLRREHLADVSVWDQFVVEVALLEALQDVGIVNRIVDCGFVSDIAQERPTGGEIISCGQQAKRFKSEQPERLAQRWRPYIALELLPAEHSLLNLVRGLEGGDSAGLRLPTHEGIALALQLAEFLHDAHARDIVYRDFKPEHVYWDGRRLRVIDLNVSRYLGSQSSAATKAAEKRADLRRCVVGVLYTVFTSRDLRFEDQSPRPAPSNPDSITARLDAVAALEFGAQPGLPLELTALLQRYAQHAAARGDDLTASSLLDELRQIAAAAGWDNGYPTTAAARAARLEVQAGLAALRSAQAQIEAARANFLRAQSLLPDDPENERLYRAASEFFRHRVLP